ncbi:hypothetical protein ACFODL_05100 [Phenylobacterium terrae]|uniref:Uncharacterized protein n=1 Tax=Phenylobacterium terrae TaxID=2665495 RepID=A0ABW4MY48_9CAUL
MHFEDRTLVRMADPASREALFSPVVAERLLSAAFGPNPLLTQPFSASVTHVALGVSAGAGPSLRGHWRFPDGRPGGDAEAVVLGLAAASGVLPAIVDGLVAATMSPVTGRIAEVSGRTAELPRLEALDAGATAAERADPARLESRRRLQLAKAVAGAGLDDADARLVADQWLSAAGAGSVAELLEAAAGPAGVERLSLKYEFTEPQAPAQQAARFVAGVVISDLAGPEPSLLEILRISRDLQRAIMATGRSTGPLGGLQPLRPAPVIWFVPAQSFEDADWPGPAGGSNAQRASARQARAAAWLADQGVALAGVE